MNAENNLWWLKMSTLVLSRMLKNKFDLKERFRDSYIILLHTHIFHTMQSYILYGQLSQRTIFKIAGNHNTSCSNSYDRYTILAKNQLHPNNQPFRHLQYYSISIVSIEKIILLNEHLPTVHNNNEWSEISQGY